MSANPYTDAQANPGVSSSEQDRTIAMLAHLSPLVLSLVSAGWATIAAPLVFWLIYKDRSPLIRRASAGAFNFTVITWVATIVLWIITIATLFVGSVVTFPLMGVIWIMQLVCNIYGAMQARRGVMYRYPLEAPILS